MPPQLPTAAVSLATLYGRLVAVRSPARFAINKAFRRSFPQLEMHVKEQSRGQPDNAGQFGPGGAGGKKEKPTKGAEKPKQASKPPSGGKVATKKDKKEEKNPVEAGSGKEKKSPSASAVPEQQPSEKAAKAKAAHKLVGKEIQRYAEEHNEPRFAKVVGGQSYPDSEPLDVLTGAGHPVELKTMVDNSNSKITMDSYAQVRKIVKEQELGKPFHTVISDDHKVFNANGAGKHDDSKRVYYYRRGIAGSARIASMHKVTSETELLRLMALPDEELPAAAQRTDGKLRVGKWKFFQDAQGKGFKNSKTGTIFRAKK